MIAGKISEAAACARWSAAYDDQGTELVYMKPVVPEIVEQAMESGMECSFYHVSFLALGRASLKGCKIARGSQHAHGYVKVNGSARGIVSKNETEKETEKEIEIEKENANANENRSEGESENGKGNVSQCMKSSWNKS